MLPAFVQDDLANVRLGDTKPFGYFWLRRTLCRQRTNLNHLGCCELCAVMRFPNELAISALAYHVIHVVLMRSQKEMVGIHTVPHVTSVEALKAIGDWAKVDLPRNAMRTFGTSSRPHDSIAASVNAALPDPAFVEGARSDVLPESFGVGHDLAMPVDIAIWLAFNNSLAGFRPSGNLRLFATAALAFAIRRGKSVLGNPGGVISYVFGKGWGMLIHGSCASSAIAQAWDGGNRCQALSIGSH